MENNQYLIIGMIGLPGRGKSYISKKISRYLNWFGLKPRIFNLGMYRRNLVGNNVKYDFFNQSNEESNKARDQCALDTLDDLVPLLLSSI